MNKFQLNHRGHRVRSGNVGEPESGRKEVDVVARHCVSEAEQSERSNYKKSSNPWKMSL